ASGYELDLGGCVNFAGPTTHGHGRQIGCMAAIECIGQQPATGIRIPGSQVDDFFQHPRWFATPSVRQRNALMTLQVHPNFATPVKLRRRCSFVPEEHVQQQQDP
ncbi:MAG TPA: hypothetical protein VK660_09180, partial [Xanthomonadaceae bacterium]|nr:hypothetical protein [Xanthomonadaceae bacterium]